MADPPLVVESRITKGEASCWIVIEPKLIHSCGRVAHVDDVHFGVPAAGDANGLLDAVKEAARAAGCYKVLASCPPAGEPIFARGGYENKGLQMRLSLRGHAGAHAAPAALASHQPQLQAPLELRCLSEADFEGGVLRLLGQLTTVGDVSRESFAFFAASSRASSSLAAFALVDAGNAGVLVGVGTLLVVSPAGKRRAHIEDIVIDESARGRGLGAQLILALVDAARAAGAETVILECSPENEGFYARLGFQRAGSSMALYFGAR